jgi:outer membrane protein assembly factor BamA
VKSGDYFDRNQTQLIRNSIKSFLADRGFQDLSISFDIKQQERLVDIDVVVDLKSITRVEEVKIATTNPKLLGRVESRFLGLKGEVLDRLRFKLIVDQLSRELFESGFYDSEVSLLPDEKVNNGEGVILRVQVKYGPLCRK